MQTSIKALILCVILCISLVTALQFGSTFISLDQIIPALMAMMDPNATTSMTNTIITDIRLPRLIYSVLTGIGLSLVGLLMQTVTRNALADPYVLGVSSGASTGAVFAIIMGGIPLLEAYNTPVFAALGAALSIILVLLCVGKSNSPVKLILIGMGMTGIFSALTMMIIYGAKHEAQVRSAMFWLLGSFAGIQWGDLPLTAIIVTLFMLYIYMFNQDLDVLLLGNHEAAQMGLSVKQLQLSIVIISSIVIATLVSKVGVVGFIGLIIPHLARIIGGPKHRNTLLFSALIGSIVMIWSDVLSRALYSPEEIPIGVLTSLLGAPLFIWIIMNRYKHNG
ncbi:iron chelate uptake ABC transporter, FeCT family, permease protein [Veillonella dispar ATCC 17748]|jgi:iron complex transport system permease protein|uniref:Iron chelate uptake ABC transporter, FeCT family, permease protein n=2 Tax=root TaxID=1 RepID=C4FP01_9FIRM|nr:MULTISPECIES: iron ABC transporter permease [Veillonella]EEP65821.1 iron chelate uptake ABC transporter, FeCT family, permease protein [Veillonella dispar ATCC 17748]MBS6674315.1 iron ABC transporter permease [Veillonella sp.]MDU1410240.1 iron ABC transporter permease [Veillonella sp.]MDU6719554.1 iron ABC transporter permease [Veillonella sp.]VEG93053.1 Iron(III) dicitrate transport system permease protein fecD [Veillonella dispar]